MSRAPGTLLRGLLLGCLAPGCGGSAPPTHYYQLAVPGSARAAAPDAQAVLAIEALAVDPAYATDRIVYRKSVYRLDYYNYHRWSAGAGLEVSRYLRDGYAREGRFARVVLEPAPASTAVLSGRVLALEEVDESEQRWLGRVALELELYGPESAQLLWSGHFVEQEPLTEQTPEGLARALSIALDRIVRRSAEPLARAAAAAAPPELP